MCVEFRVSDSDRNALVKLAPGQLVHRQAVNKGYLLYALIINVQYCFEIYIKWYDWRTIFNIDWHHSELACYKLKGLILRLTSLSMNNLEHQQVVQPITTRYLWPAWYHPPGGWPVSRTVHVRSMLSVVTSKWVKKLDVKKSSLDGISAGNTSYYQASQTIRGIGAALVLATRICVWQVDLKVFTQYFQRWKHMAFAANIWFKKS